MKTHRWICLLLSLCLVFIADSSSAALAMAPNDQALRIVMPMVTLNNQDDRAAYAKALLSENGFDVEIEVHTGSTTDYYAQYMEYVWQHIDENAVFIVSNSIQEALKEEGILQNWEAALAVAAPGYADRLSASEGDYQSIPTNFILGDLCRVVVLTKNDDYENYGKDLQKAGDVEDLLMNLREQSPDSVPGLASPYLHDRIYSSTGNFTILSLFLPEHGYYPVGLNCFYDTDAEEIREASQLPASEEAFKTIARWHDSRLVDFWNGNFVADAADYSVVLMNLSDFFYNRLATIVPMYNDFDWSEYRISILYSDEIPYNESLGTTSTNFAVAGENADKETFASLLQWLEVDENYRTFFYGIEGVDYELVDDAVRTVETDLQYSLWDQLAFFRRDDKMIPLANWPKGMAEDLESLTHPSELPIPSGVLAAVEASILENSELFAETGEAFSKMLALVSTVCTPTASYETSMIAIHSFFTDAVDASYAKQIEGLFYDTLRE